MELIRRVLKYGGLMCLILMFYLVLIPFIWVLSVYQTWGHIDSFLLASGLQGVNEDYLWKCRSSLLKMLLN